MPGNTLDQFLSEIWNTPSYRGFHEDLARHNYPTHVGTARR